MNKPKRADAPAAVPPQAGAPAGRIVSIDILRGLAILWVIVFHLYVDMSHRTDTASLYPRFRDQLLDGKPQAALTAFAELVFGHGYLGVPLFMMLSGISLTMNACWRDEPGILRGYWTRFRRLLPVYWGGVALILGAVAIVALLQMAMDGGSFTHQWFSVTIADWESVHIWWDDVLWALSVFGWAFRARFGTPAVGSLWFVELLLQYYLLFPFALMLLKRIGPWQFAAASLVLMLAARAIYVPLAYESMRSLYAGRNLATLAVFRGWEFFLGMSIGYLFASRREEVARWVRAPMDTAGVVAVGIACVACGVILSQWNKTTIVVSDPWITAGLALVIVPLLFKAPGWLERSVPARLLVFLGVVSMTALIVNDMFRFFASFLRVEGLAHGPLWWFFLVVVYVPVGTLLAYPLAALFGLLPQQRARARAAVQAPDAKRAPAQAAVRSSRRVAARRAR